MSDDLKITCPNCKRDIRVELSELKPGRSKSCPYCATKITFTGSDVEKEIDDTIKSVFKGFKGFKFR